MRNSKLAVAGVAVVAATAAVFSTTALGGDNDSGFKIAHSNRKNNG